MKKGEKKLFNHWVDCSPPRTTKQHARVVKLKSGRSRCFQPARVTAAQENVLALFLPYAPSTPFVGPLRVKLELVYPWRKNEPKKNRKSSRRWKNSRPDLDNLAKLILDALTPKFFIDDSQVCAMSYTKQWGDQPGIGLSIPRLSG